MNETALTALFDRFTKLKVLVIGDVMLDRYIHGKVERISPEAPVPVVNVNRHEDRLGGAANVALNVLAMGAKVKLAAVIGHDQTGDAFLASMKDQALDTDGMLRVNRPTTLKMRIMGNKHQLLRLDEEDDRPLDQEAAHAFKTHVGNLMSQADYDVLIFEDYDKGLIDPLLIQSLVELAGQKNIPIAVDPKRRNFSAYSGVTLIKPNLKEIREGLKIEVDPSNPATVHKAGVLMREKIAHSISLITMSEYGMYAANEQESYFLPAHVRNIADVSGAGDTVISVAALCLGARTDLSTLAMLSNLAGGQVCEKPGVVPVHAGQLLNEALRFIR